MRREASLSQIGLDIHRKFSKVTARDSDTNVAWRQRLEHADRPRVRQELECWPKGTPVVLEGTFGWGWMSDELKPAGWTRIWLPVASRRLGDKPCSEQSLQQRHRRGSVTRASAQAGFSVKSA